MSIPWKVINAVVSNFAASYGFLINTVGCNPEEHNSERLTSLSMTILPLTLLGIVQAVFRRPQIKAFVSLHSQAEGLGGNLSTDEISVIQGALDLGSKPASACMTPLEKATTFLS